MKHETQGKSRFYERFQVEDVINFFSGQLLQAKSPDGAQVFLQAIKVRRRPLPKGFQDALRKLQHPNLAPILDVMEEEDQIILVHPPFSGDPLPLIVNKERTMDPDNAVRIVHNCLRTLQDLERLPLPLSATLDPKNILLVGHKPLLLFYYVKDSKQSTFDEKWRELLFYLVTGQAPIGGLKQCEKLLDEKKIPSRVARLALQCLDRKFSLGQITHSVGRYVASRSREEGGESGRKGRSRKTLYTAIGVAAAALVLVTLSVSSQIGLGEAYNQWAGEREVRLRDGEIVDQFTFTKHKEWFTLPYTFKDVTNIRGDFTLKTLNGFTGYVETKDRQSVFGFYVKKETGIVSLFYYMKGKMYPIGESGEQFRIKPGKKYTFEVIYIPGEPVRISIQEYGEGERYVAVGTTHMNGELTMRFRGEEGATLYFPQMTSTDRQALEQTFLNGQPWRIGYGQGIIRPDDEYITRLSVYPNTQIRINAAESDRFAFIPPEKGNPLQLNLQGVDNSMYRLVWQKNEKKLVLYLLEQKLVETPVNWEPKKDKPILVTFTPDQLDKLSVTVSQDSNQTEIKYTNPNGPVAIREVSMIHEKGLELVGVKTSGE
ncbi:hypothetical protein [Staphylospora marina]|uniref:hypothetical protein n=1 Tax=Staphylospora marina TaxID=2490858 RepID=UPI000F5BDFB0|nr:hypothetical protein [Staphylospora marina]